MNQTQPLKFQSYKQVEQAIYRYINAYEIAGVSAGIVMNGQMVYIGGFGVMDMHTQKPLTPDALFSVASISKTLVATAILQLVEQGKLDLETRLADCLPYFQLEDLRYKQITLRQMLTHTSGLPDLEDYMWDPPEYDDKALERFVRSMRNEQLQFAPGERFSYCNTAYDVLGEVIARISGGSFEDYIEQSILDPLGMEQSSFLPDRVPPKLITSPHLSLPFLEPAPVYPYTRSHAPCGSLHSNVVELSRWAKANLNRGCLESTQILRHSSYDLLWHPQVRVDEPGADEFMGLSWFLGKYKGYKTISHSGSDIGFNTYLTLLPEKAVAIVVLSNSYPVPVKSIVNSLLDIILGYEPDPPKSHIILTLSSILKNQGLQAAFENLQRIKENHPDSYDFNVDQFSGIAYALTEIKRVKEAIQILQLGIEIHPKDDGLLYLLASAYEKNDEKDMALHYCQLCLMLNPNHWDAIRLLKRLQK